MENLSPKFFKGREGPRLYLFDKPQGLSTFDVIRRVRSSITTHKKREKIGHLGTLDPFATGLVVVAVGGAARLNNLAHEFLPKTYLARGILGEKRDSGDVTGEKVIGDFPTAPLSWPKHREELQKIFNSFVQGDYWQSPPAYSAAKYKGKSLYTYARRGVTILKNPVRRKIYRLEVTDYTFPGVNFLTSVGQGTYIRVLWEDMASRLGGAGYLHSLRRLSYGKLSVEQALPVPGEKDTAALPPLPSLSPHEFLPFPKIYCGEKEKRRFLQGGPISLKALATENFPPQQKYCWAFDSRQLLLGLGVVGEGKVAPQINFTSYRE